MEANKYGESWDHFLEAYGSMKKQRDSLVNIILNTVEVLERDGYKQAAEFTKNQFGRFKNGEDIGHSISGNETKSGT